MIASPRLGIMLFYIGKLGVCCFTGACEKKQEKRNWQDMKKRLRFQIEVFGIIIVFILRQLLGIILSYIRASQVKAKNIRSGFISRNTIRIRFPRQWPKKYQHEEALKERLNMFAQAKDPGYSVHLDFHADKSERMIAY